MDNEALKEVFKALHSKIVAEINPVCVIDKLYSKAIITDENYSNLRQVPNDRDRSRQLFPLLRSSSHPETFVQVREALRDEYPWIVEDIDKQLTSPTIQLQQLHLSQSTDGKFLYSAYNIL